MKNKKLRNVLISVCSAVLVGVLLLGINAAVGVAPGYDPPGTGISPTFTGLQVTGDTQIAGSTVIYGNFMASGDTNRFDGDLEVDGVLEVLETLEVSSFYGIATSDASPVLIDDDLEVTGDVQLGSGAMFGSVYRVKSFLFGAVLHIDSCHSDDILLSCGGYSSVGLKSVYPTETSCAVLSTSTSTIYVYLTCLDPEGIRMGLNP